MLMKWEYKTAVINHVNLIPKGSDTFELPEVDEFLRQFGSFGWELVSTEGLMVDTPFTQPHTETVILFFKRPLN